MNMINQRTSLASQNQVCVLVCKLFLLYYWAVLHGDSCITWNGLCKNYGLVPWWLYLVVCFDAETLDLDFIFLKTKLTNISDRWLNLNHPALTPFPCT